MKEKKKKKQKQKEEESAGPHLRDGQPQVDCFHGGVSMGRGAEERHGKERIQKGSSTPHAHLSARRRERSQDSRGAKPLCRGPLG